MRRAALALVAVATLAVAGCTEEAAPTPPTVTVTATPDAVDPFADFAAPELLSIPGAVVEGLEVEHVEAEDETHVAFASYPLIPGAEDLTEALKASREDQFRDFVATEHPAQEGVLAELNISWDLVGSSPEVIGVRLNSTEFGAHGFDGDASTHWYHVEADEVLPGTALIDEAAVDSLVAAVEDEATGDPRIDPALLEQQLAGGLDAFDSIAFTADGELWVEFDGAQVSVSNRAVGVEVPAEGHLSEFGETARTAALEPADPDIPVPEPTTAEPAPLDTEGTPAMIQGDDDVDCSQAKCIALTFDDGPVGGTNDLLDVLASRGVHATFFMVGTNVKAHPDVVKRIHDEGHVLGNHTMDHKQLTRLNEASIRDEIASTNALIEEASGVTPVLLRPPYGATNGSVATIAAELGMAQILWDVDPEDWKDKNSAVVTDRVLSHAHNGAIILSHDIHETTRAAYAGIIDQLLADGYTLVTVPELLGDMTPGQKYFRR
ncbi:polysaccharide deacetylase family protein [Demequina sp. NBRC 110056]|uniref:polysaccharide deacetylase family protein n=1 Tax=Demequina sp. NBRC 110056 TaxID=1570345 RepID=UPI00117FEF17|nr:polysaccharide deacetylase family protein [Demequina sp. NBRC 110056]